MTIVSTVCSPTGALLLWRRSGRLCAVGQFTGTRNFVVIEVDRALQIEPALRAEVERARVVSWDW